MSDNQQYPGIILKLRFGNPYGNFSVKPFIDEQTHQAVIRGNLDEKLKTVILKNWKTISDSWENQKAAITLHKATALRKSIEAERPEWFDLTYWRERLILELKIRASLA